MTAAQTTFGWYAGVRAVRWTEHGASVVALAKRRWRVVNGGRSRRAWHCNNSILSTRDTNSTGCGSLSHLLGRDSWSAVEALVILVEGRA
jgi:hypothetical protein